MRYTVFETNDMYKHSIKLYEVTLKTVLYADVLFVVNFGMDVISIWLTFLIVHQKTSAPRLLSASALGGAYGVLSVVIGSSGLVSFLLSIIVSFIMIFISACGRLTLKYYLKYTLILWGVGALSGGIITALCTLGGNVYDIRTHNSSFFILAGGVAAATAVVRLFSNNRISDNCKVIIKEFGSVFEFEALVDSGNVASEPISSLPIIFVSKTVFSINHDIDVLTSANVETEKLSNNMKRKIRIVSIRTVNDSCVKYAVIPEEVYIVRRRSKKRVRAAVVIEDKPDYNGFAGIVPASLLR